MKDLIPADLQFRMRERARRPRFPKSHRNNAFLKSVAQEVGEIADGVEYWIVENSFGKELREAAELLEKHEGEGEDEIRDMVDSAAEEMGLSSMVLRPSAFLRSLIGALNGYVVFPRRHAPVRMGPRATGILEYVPVHGGITYAVKDSLGCVFGFDTAHHDSPGLPTHDKKFIQWQCRLMYEGLVIAGKIEDDYARAKGNNRRRADIVQPLLDLVPEQGYSLGVMLNILGGEL